MLDDDNQNSTADQAPEPKATKVTTTRRRAVARPAGPPTFSAKPAPVAAPESAAEAENAAPTAESSTAASPAASPGSTTASTTAGASESAAGDPAATTDASSDETAEKPAKKATRKRKAPVAGLVFQPPPEVKAPPRKRAVAKPVADESTDDAADRPADRPADRTVDTANDTGTTSASDSGNDADSGDQGEGSPRRRRSRGGRRRRKSDDQNDQGGQDDQGESAGKDDSGSDAGSDAVPEAGSESSTRRRRRRARAGEDADVNPDDPENTVVKVREGRTAEDEITGVTGSTRLEAKKQRRREGREAGRRRAPIVSEAEFLARREAVNREMVVRQLDDYTQIAVLEDKVLVEHYVARESQTSLIGNVYLGKVQNVLPSMEAAFVDIGAGRNAVIYAGEVDWSGVQNGKQRKIEDALTPGQSILVQVTKDPIGQKGARLTSQISLPGRFLVYVPGGGASGISRKLPDSERARLKGLLKEVVPDDANVIVRTAAEGATEDQLTRDVKALTLRWEDIERKVEAGKAPELLYAEPDLMIKVIRDLFNEDFAKLIVDGDEAWDMVSGYISHVAPDLEERVERWNSAENDGKDIFTAYRLDEQIHKALDRKVNLPSGGSLVIDRTEAMTVVDVNTGRFTGSGGNLEETVTKNNLEAAEEIVRQLRLRDIGGIIVVDFIDMVLESNRDLVLRRLVECLGRDRTRHQVAEVTSLGLVQMTRKRIGTGLLESFSHDCEHCKGRGVMISDTPIEARKDDGPRRGRRGGGQNRSRGSNQGGQDAGQKPEKSPEKNAEKSPEKNAEKASDQDSVKADQQGADQKTGPKADAKADAKVDPKSDHAADQTSDQGGGDPGKNPRKNSGRGRNAKASETSQQPPADRPQAGPNADQSTGQSTGQSRDAAPKGDTAPQTTRPVDAAPQVTEAPASDAPAPAPAAPDSPVGDQQHTAASTPVLTEPGHDA